MPAQSQQQQKLFGLALAVKRGEVSPSEVSDEVKDIVDRMSEKDIEDFAGTKHDGLPKKVEAQIREMVREIMRERAIAELELSKDDMEKLHSDGEVEVDGEKVSFEEAELPKAMIPSNIKAKLNMAIDKIKDTDLTYNQKLQVIGKIINSLGIDKKELVKMSTRLKGTLESVMEGKKRFRQQDGIGKAKYTISYHDGKQKHKDGSDFFGIQIFKNKKDLETFRNSLLKKGFVEESIEEGIEPQIKKIAHFTGTRPEAVEDFVSKHALNITKLLKYVEKGGLPQRMELVSALAGRPNNPVQKKIIKMFNESINEGYSTEEKRIVMMAVRKLAKYRNVPLDYAINDLLGAGQELERDIKRGKITK